MNIKVHLPTLEILIQGTHSAAITVNVPNDLFSKCFSIIEILLTTQFFSKMPACVLSTASTKMSKIQSANLRNVQSRDDFLR